MTESIQFKSLKKSQKDMAFGARKKNFTNIAHSEQF